MRHVKPTKTFMLTFVVLGLLMAAAVSAQTGDSIPLLKLNCPEVTQRSGEKSYVEAVIDGNVDQKVNFRWSISEGNIVHGQGTNRITILIPHDKTSYLTARVEAKGDFVGMIAEKCSFLSKPVPKSELLDEIKFTIPADLNVWVDLMAVWLYSTERTSCHIIIFAKSPEKYEEIVKLINDHLSYRQHDLDRVVFVQGEKSSKNLIRFWLVPDGAEAPTAVLKPDPPSKKQPE